MVSRMRILVLTLVLGLVLTGCGDQQKLQKSLWGEWIGQGGVVVEFSASGLVHMQVPSGPTRDGMYVANFGTNPYQLDIDLKDGKPIHTIFRFDMEGRLVLEGTEPGKSRPTEFTNAAVYFTRKAPEPTSK